MTCRERYDKFVDTQIIPTGECLTEGELCTTIRDCEALWDRYCSDECPKYEPHPGRACANIDDSAKSL